ncbi:MAG TPA: hypothetical protein VFG50_00685 [Rhodothermales bacterium]|nr:hypothetical protein [Rhodothermales bacterium]
MASNTYVPKGLPLLCDAVLIKTMKEYGKSYASLAHSVFPSAARLRREIGLAMLAIERELDARGVPTPLMVHDSGLDIPSTLVQESSEPISRQARITA